MPRELLAGVEFQPDQSRHKGLLDDINFEPAGFREAPSTPSVERKSLLDAFTLAPESPAAAVTPPSAADTRGGAEPITPTPPRPAGPSPAPGGLWDRSKPPEAKPKGEPYSRERPPDLAKDFRRYVGQARDAVLAAEADYGPGSPQHTAAYAEYRQMRRQQIQAEDFARASNMAVPEWQRVIEGGSAGIAQGEARVMQGLGSLVNAVIETPIALGRGAVALTRKAVKASTGVDIPDPLPPFRADAGTPIYNLGIRLQNRVQEEFGLPKATVDNPKQLVDPQWWAQNLAEQAVYYVPALLAGIASGGSTVIAGAVAGLLEGAADYEELKREGVNTPEAVMRMAAGVAIVGWLNSLGFKEVLKGPGMRTSWQAFLSALKAFASEGTTEALEEPVQALTRSAGRVPGAEMVAQLVAAAKSGLDAFILGGVMGGATRVMEIAAEDVEDELLARREAKIGTRAPTPGMEYAADAIARAAYESARQRATWDMVLREKMTSAGIPADTVEKILREEDPEKRKALIADGMAAAAAQGPQPTRLTAETVVGAPSPEALQTILDDIQRAAVHPQEALQGMADDARAEIENAAAARAEAEARRARERALREMRIEAAQEAAGFDPVGAKVEEMRDAAANRAKVEAVVRSGSTAPLAAPAAPTQEAVNASRVREDAGRLPTRRPVPEGGAEEGGANLEQPAPREPRGPAQRPAEAESAPAAGEVEGEAKAAPVRKGLPQRQPKGEAAQARVAEAQAAVDAAGPGAAAKQAATVQRTMERSGRKIDPDAEADARIDAAMQAAGMRETVVEDDVWAREQRIVMQGGGLPGPMRVDPRNRVIRRPHGIGSDTLRRGRAHEIGHQIDKDNGVMQRLADDLDKDGLDELGALMVEGLPRADGGVDETAWREGLRGGDQNGIPGEAVAQAIGLRLLNPTEFARRYPRVAAALDAIIGTENIPSGKLAGTEQSPATPSPEASAATPPVSPALDMTREGRPGWTMQYSSSDFGTERMVTVRDDNGNIIGQRDPFMSGIPSDTKRRAARIRQVAQEIVKDWEKTDNTRRGRPPVGDVVQQSQAAVDAAGPDMAAKQAFPTELARRLLALPHEKRAYPSGDENAELRPDVIEAITGTRPPKSRAGATAVREALAKHFSAPKDAIVVVERHIVAELQKIAGVAQDRAPEAGLPVRKPASSATVPTRTPIGKNPDGLDLFEDDKGARYYVENGIRITQPVRVVPGRGAEIPGVDELKQQGRTSFLTEAERAPETPVEEPARPQKPEVKSPLANLSSEKQARAKALQDKIRKRLLGSAGMGQMFDPEVLTAGAELAGLYVEGGTKTFKQFAANVKADMADVWDRIKRYLHGIWQSAGADNPGLEDISRADAQKVIDGLESPAPAADQEDQNLAASIRLLVESTDTPQQKAHRMRRLAESAGLTLKAMQERVEFEIVRMADEIARSDQPPRMRMAMLIRLYDRQPSLSARTSTSVENQAYSTPAPLAFLVGHMIDLESATTVYEPTAGNGMLLIGIDKGRVIANELDPSRAANLRTLGVAEVYTQDATDFSAPRRVVAVVANPPFGPLSEGTRNFQGYAIKRLDHLIALNAVESLIEGGTGRAAIILGANMEAGKIGQGADRTFLNYLYNNFTVAANFEIDGELYGKQGAKWPVRVIVLDGRRADAPAKAEDLAPKSVDRLMTWDDAWKRGMEVRRELEARRARMDAQEGHEPRVPSGTEAGPAPQPGAVPVAPGGPAAAPGRGGRSGRRGPRGTPASGQPSVRGSDDAAGGTPAGGQAPAPSPGSVAPGGLGVSPVGVAEVGGRSGAEPGAAGEPARGPGVSVGPGTVEVRGKPTTLLGAPRNEGQREYVPASQSASLETLVPENIAEGVASSLVRLREKVGGDIDEWVRQKLGYDSKGQLFRALAGEQVDGVALAIDQIETGGALIIGDETGIGKGRQAAAIMRYCQQNGITPVFFTKDPKLFTDLKRDADDVGYAFRPFILGDQKKGAIVDENNNVLFRPPAGTAARTAAIARITQDGMDAAGYDAVVVTYSQINVQNDQQRFLTRLSNDGRILVILDESHEGSGAESMQGVFLRGGMIQKGSGANRRTITLPGLLNGRGVAGTVYLSATYAKRPENMPLYSRTKLGQAAQNVQQLVQAMKRGGVALQQAISESLAQVGQYIRRERDFTGVTFDRKLVQADRTDELTATVDRVTEVFREIKAFSELVRDAVQHGALGGGRATTQTQAQIDYTEFASIAHNYVSQMLLAAKVNTVIEEAVAAHRRGEKPVIALMNTMEAGMDDLAEQSGWRVGDAVQLQFRDFVRRALDRTLRVSEKDAQGNSTTTPFTAADVGLQDEYDAIVDAIEDLDVDLPVSPIDAILSGLRSAGIRVGELTGRTSGIRYSDETFRSGTYERRQKADKNALVNGFNNGDLDALVLNASGSTGLSIHASPLFKERPIKTRHMIVAQPHLDVNVVVQTLGRIKRTGMIPGGARYTLPVLPLEVERRPAMVLERKLKSLNANTTASADGAVKLDQVDFMNKYGDEVIAKYLVDDDPDLQDDLNLSPTVNDNGEIRPEKDDYAVVFTGRMALMPNARQRAAYDAITEAYQQYVDYLKATDQYDLEVGVYEDWDGVQQSDDVLLQGEDESSIFTASTKLQRWEIKDTRHVPTAEEMQREFSKKLESAERVQARLDHFEEDIRRRFEQKLAPLESELATLQSVPVEERDVAKVNRLLRLQANLIQARDQFTGQTAGILRQLGYSAGEFVRIENNEEHDESLGMLVDITLPKQPEGFVKARPGSIVLSLLTNRPGGRLRLPLSQITTGRFSVSRAYVEDSDVDVHHAGGRYERHVIVGNPIRAIAAAGNRGRLVAFKARDGRTVNGLLLPMSWTPDQMQSDPRADLVNARAVALWMDRDGSRVSSGDASIEIPYGRASRRRITVPAARARGGPIYLDKAIRRITGDFEKRGNKMQADIGQDDVEKVARRIMEITTRPFRPERTRGGGDVIQQVQSINANAVRRHDGPRYAMGENPPPLGVTREQFDATLDVPRSVAKEAERRWPGVSVSLYSAQDGRGRLAWHLSAIEVPKGQRRKGTGTAVMEFLSAEADRAGAIITLSPSTDFGATSVDRLRSFYRRFGFVRNTGRTADYALNGAMYRRPTGRAAMAPTSELFPASPRGVTRAEFDATLADETRVVPFAAERVTAGLSTDTDADTAFWLMLEKQGEGQAAMGEAIYGQPVVDFSKAAEWHDVFFREPTPERLADLARWLKDNPNAYIRLYHGTAAVNPIRERGVLRTRSGRRNSLQSGSGYTYWSVYPGQAKSFGDYASSNRGPDAEGHKTAVYSVPFRVAELLPDTDQLRNQRLYAKREVGNTLAESLAFGHGARVKSDVIPARIEPNEARFSRSRPGWMEWTDANGNTVYGKFSRNGQVRAITYGNRSHFFLDRYENASQLRDDIREEAGHRLVNELGGKAWAGPLGIGHRTYRGSWSSVAAEIERNYGYKRGTPEFSHELVAKAFRDGRHNVGLLRRFLDAVAAAFRQLARKMSGGRWLSDLSDAEVRNYLRQLLAAKARQVERQRASVSVSGPQYAMRDPFYSALTRAVDSLPGTFKAPGDQFLKRLEGLRNKGQAWKDQEAEESGFADWLKMQQENGISVTRESALAFLEQNGVRVDEVIKGDTRTGRWTKFSQYAPHGGEPGTYREVLFLLPRQIDTSAIDSMDFAELGRAYKARFGYNPILEPRRYGKAITEPELREIIRSLYVADERKKQQPDDYRSPHWSEPNVIAHMLMDERRIPLDVLERTQPELAAKLRAEGKTEARALHMIEGQSDLHQSGAAKGYGPAKVQRGYAIESNRGVEHGGRIFATKAEAEQAANFIRSDVPSVRIVERQGEIEPGVPALPMRGDAWKRLVIRKMLAEAAAGGYDLLTWSTGEDRFRKWGSQRVDWKKHERASREVRSRDDGKYMVWDNVRRQAYGPYNTPQLAEAAIDETLWWTVSAQEQTGGEHEGQNIEALARERGVLLEQRGQTVRTKEDLRRVIESIKRGDETNVDKLTDRIWERMQSEPEGTSLPRKEFFEFLYDQSFRNEASAIVKKMDKGVRVADLQWGTGQREISEDGRTFRRPTGAPAMSVHAIPISGAIRSAVAQGQPYYRAREGEGYAGQQTGTYREARGPRGGRGVSEAAWRSRLDSAKQAVDRDPAADESQRRAWADIDIAPEFAGDEDFRLAAARLESLGLEAVPVRNAFFNGCVFGRAVFLDALYYSVSLENIALHEVFHAMRRSAQAGDFVAGLVALVDDKSPAFQSYAKALKDKYHLQGIDVEYTDAQVAEEIAADWFAGILQFRSASGLMMELSGAFSNAQQAREWRQALHEGLRAVAAQGAVSERGPPPPRYMAKKITPEQDAAYMAAVERGDTATAQRMVDEAAVADGYSGYYWHGTDAEFTVFDALLTGSKTPASDLGTLGGGGFSFSPYREVAAQYGNRVMRVFLKADRVVDVKGANPLDSAPDKITRLTRKIRRENPDIGGIVLETGFGTQEIVVFSPSQIKSADPITRDDAGNVIPLSQRFAQASPDIRYMPKDVPPERHIQKLAEEIDAAIAKRKLPVVLSPESLARLRRERFGLLRTKEGIPARISKVKAAERERARAKIRDLKAVLPVRVKAAEAKTVSKAAEYVRKHFGEQAVPEQTKSFNQVLRAAIDAAKKAGKEIGGVKALADTIDIAFAALARQYRGVGPKWIGALERIGMAVEGAQEALRGAADPELADAVIKDFLVDAIGEQRYRAVRLATKGDREKTLAAVAARVQQHLGRAYGRSIEKLVEIADPAKMFNEPIAIAEEQGRQPIRLGDSFRGALVEIGKTAEDIRALKDAKARQAWLVRQKAQNADIQRTRERIEELRSRIAEDMGKRPWFALKKLYENLAQTKALSDLMQDSIKAGRVMRRSELGEAATDEVLASGISELADVTDPRRGFIKHWLHDINADASVRALMLTGGRDETASKAVFYDALRDAEDAALTMWADGKRALAAKLKELGIGERQMLGWYVHEAPRQIAGATWTLTDAEIMDLYALSLDQDRDRVFRNGVKRRAFTGKYGDRYEIRGATADETESSFYDLFDAALSPQQKQLVEWMVGYVTSLGDAGNAVSFRLWGYEKFASDAHWRFRVDRGATETRTSEVKDLDSFRNTRLDRVGMLMDRVQHRNPFLIENVFEVFDRQVMEMADFTHLTLPTLDALYVMQHPGFRTAVEERFGREFHNRTRHMLARLSHLESHADNWNSMERLAASIQRNAAVSILGWRITSILSNRIGGSILLVNELDKIKLGLGAKYAAQTRMFGAKPFSMDFWNARTQEDVDALLNHGYFYHRWVVDNIRTMANLPIDEVKGLPRSRAALWWRQMQQKGLQPMALAEMRNAIQAYRVLRADGYSQAEAVDLVAKLTRQTQNPSSALDESGFYEEVRSRPFAGLLLPFLGQPAVASNVLRRDILRLHAAREDVAGRGKAVARVLGDLWALHLNVLLTVALRKLARMAARGLMPWDDDDRERAYTVLDYFTQVLDDLVFPGGGRFVEGIRAFATMMPGESDAAEMIRSLGTRDVVMEGLATRALSLTVRGLQDIVKGAGKDDPRKTTAGVLRLIEGASMVAGAGVGGILQALRIGSGLAGWSLTATKPGSAPAAAPAVPARPVGLPSRQPGLSTQQRQTIEAARRRGEAARKEAAQRRAP